jgi:hypothetical protein
MNRRNILSTLGGGLLFALTGKSIAKASNARADCEACGSDHQCAGGWCCQGVCLTCPHARDRQHKNANGDCICSHPKRVNGTWRRVRHKLNPTKVCSD